MTRLALMLVLFSVGCAYGVEDPAPSGHVSDKSSDAGATTGITFSCAEADGAPAPCFDDPPPR